ncbi:MAG: DUF1549 domain-containing protein [Planctomycetaceae bacterium]
MRRVTLDLHGVPPTYAEVAAFVADDSEDAYAKPSTGLLESPSMVSVGAGTGSMSPATPTPSGYVFTENPTYPFSYTYRDYVVDSLNSDKPYDRFVTEQLAADKLGLPEGDAPLAASGFITAGPRFLNRRNRTSSMTASTW